ncbi:MAG: MBOAT family protein [Rhodocyclales bacterium]|nr:MBOAT family protein [Rhodocyclales bacterium]
MLFNSATFLFFFAVFYLVYTVIPSWNAKKWVLLLAGLVFYGWFNPYYIGLLFLSAAIDHASVLVIAGSKDDKLRRTALVACIVGNLSILCAFKYYDFFIGNVAAALAAVGLQFSAPVLGLLLPIGISFYTFESICYAVDVYRGTSRPARSFFDLISFISFFPHLVAGPIVRARDFLPQLETPRVPTPQQRIEGLSWIVGGYFMKMGVADNLALSVGKVFAAPAALSLPEAWLGAIYFSFQIFCDFAGYTLIARGLAKLMGFELCANFNFPYLATGFSDFWKRWHISLSSWLRDYLYIPLGGNRKGLARTYANLAITMLLGGLWHGASWTFVAWGGLHAAYLIVEHALRSRMQPSAAPPAWARLLAILATYTAVTLAWVFFRAATFGDATAILAAMFGLSGPVFAVPDKSILKNGVWLLPMAAYFAWGYARERNWVLAIPPGFLQAAGLAGLAFVTLLCRGTSDAFIYFQF